VQDSAWNSEIGIGIWWSCKTWWLSFYGSPCRLFV